MTFGGFSRVYALTDRRERRYYSDGGRAATPRTRISTHTHTHTRWVIDQTVSSAGAATVGKKKYPPAIRHTRTQGEEKNPSAALNAGQEACARAFAGRTGHHYAPSHRRGDVLRRWRCAVRPQRLTRARIAIYIYVCVSRGIPERCVRSTIGVRLTARASPCVCRPGGARGRGSGARKRGPAAHSDGVITGSRRIGASRVSGPVCTSATHRGRRLHQCLLSRRLAHPCTHITCKHSRGLYWYTRRRVRLTHGTHI